MLWSPADATGGRPLVLLGHGGGQHKQAPGLVARAHRYVTARGFGVAAIDAPGHGDRPRTEQDERFAAGIRQRIAAGEPIGPHVARDKAERAARAVPEWRATIDALQELDIVAAGGPVGFWGVSLGSAIGVPLAAAEPRITAAVFGLVGHEALAEAAARVTIPVEFLLQWDDELIPRDSGVALFDAFASREKTLHANPGRHVEVPAFELESSERFHPSPCPGQSVREGLVEGLCQGSGGSDGLGGGPLTGGGGPHPLGRPVTRRVGRGRGGRVGSG